MAGAGCSHCPLFTMQVLLYLPRRRPPAHRRKHHCWSHCQVSGRKTRSPHWATPGAGCSPVAHGREAKKEQRWRKRGASAGGNDIVSKLHIAEVNDMRPSVHKWLGVGTHLPHASACESQCVETIVPTRANDSKTRINGQQHQARSSVER